MDSDEKREPGETDLTDIDAPEEAVPDEESSKSAAWKRVNTLVWSVVLVLILVVGNEMISLPYYVLAPGGARPVNQAITLPQDKEFPPEGRMLFTTVSLIQAHPFDILYSQFDASDQIEKRKTIIGDSTPKQFLQGQEQSMEDSRLIATAVAMRKAGYSVTQQGDGAGIAQVVDGSPADGKFQPGDYITAINGTAVRVASDVTTDVRDLPVGTSLAIDVTASDGTKRTVDLKTALRPNTESSSYVGVTVQTKNPRLDTPFPVNVDLGSVGGPSAGLAMTIALLDELTPGELTGGGDIAATGTMDLDGKVGPIGGLKQKVAAVRRESKAKIFIVPAEEVDEARRYAGKDLQIVPADTLDQAVDAIIAAGGQRPGPVPSI